MKIRHAYIRLWDKYNEGWRGIVLYAVLGIAAAVILNAVFGLILGTSFPVVTVSSSSMVPTLNVGDLVIVGSQKTYEIEDIIVFRGWESKPIIHRVVAKYENGRVTRREGWNEISDADIQHKAGDAETIYITRGDHNPSCDQCGGGRPPVRQEQIAGRSLFHVPYLGFVKLYAVQYVWNPLTGR
ncbi:MAG: signal peptidase I [Candidatus Aenigmarchaeota archaeon]|nr:signal peptidase I [Candidatus Aenigmarchaeota archaeon]